MHFSFVTEVQFENEIEIMFSICDTILIKKVRNCDIIIYKFSDNNIYYVYVCAYFIYIRICRKNSVLQNTLRCKH